MVALIVRGDGHDGAGAVAGEHIVGDPDGDLLAVHRIDRGEAERHAGLLLGEVRALQIAFGVACLPVSLHGIALCGGGDLLDQRMLRRQHQIGGSKEGVGAGGEDRDALRKSIEGEADLGSFTAPDPVPLE